ncbi:DnaT-like ssDNA-binding domain-containing protein [Ectopseudomonas mendocina]|uniref:DnaT-like ssDNA-binding domain-containing protein n=1 Tax=Ectopseudomonas mendocina TaxID=300 RepID=A0ABZ2RMK4_ECTME
MGAYQINDEEREALRGLPMLAREIYVFGLRPFMDYASGVVGARRGVSWKSIAEELYVEPHQGIKGGEPSEKELRRALMWLQRVGLLGPNQAERRLIFELLLASRDKSAQKKVGSKWADEVGREEGSQQPSNDKALQEKEGSQVAGGELPKVGTPPVSGLPPNPPPSEIAQRFQMHDTWQPSPKGWKATCVRRAINPESLTEDLFREFLSYWINRPDKCQSQGQWEHELAQSLQRKVRNDEANNQRRGAEQSSFNHGSSSLADELNDTSWADRLQLHEG